MTNQNLEPLSVLTVGDKNFEIVDKGVRESLSIFNTDILKTTNGPELIHTIDDAYKRKLLGLSVYGKSVLTKTPTVTDPANIESINNLSLIYSGQNILKLTPQTYTSGVATVEVSNNNIISITTSESNAETISIHIDFDIPIIIPRLAKLFMRNDITSERVTFGNIGLDIRNKQYNFNDSSYGTYYKRFTLAIKPGDAISSAFVFQPTIETTANLSNNINLNQNITNLILIDTQETAHELRSAGNTSDELIINEDGTGTLIEKTIKRAYAAVDSIVIWTTGEKHFYIDTPNEVISLSDVLSPNIDLLSNRFESGYPSVLSENTCIFLRERNKKLCIQLKESDMSICAPSGYTTAGLSEFNSWLAQHPFEVILPRDPSAYNTYTIPAINMPSFISDQSNLWVNCNNPNKTIVPSSSIIYQRDISTVINNIEQAIADLVVTG